MSVLPVKKSFVQKREMKLHHVIGYATLILIQPYLIEVCVYDDLVETFIFGKYIKHFPGKSLLFVKILNEPKLCTI